MRATTFLPWSVCICAVLLTTMFTVAPTVADANDPISDLDGDCHVGLPDLAELLSEYNQVGDSAWEVDDHTVAYWPLNGLDPARIGLDFSDNGNDLTVKADRVGILMDAPYCRGVLMGDDPWEGDCENSDGGALTAPGAGCTYPGSGDWTVEAWIYFPSNSAYYEVITHYSEDVAGHEPYKLTITNGVAEFFIQDAANDSAAASADISAYRGQWIHLAGQYAYQQQVALYLNEEELAATATTLVPETRAGDDVYLGGSYCGTTTGLKIDEARISDALRFGCAALCTGIVNVGDNPSSIALDPSGDIAYVSCTGANAFYTIGTDDCSVSEPFDVGTLPYNAVFNSDGSRMYLATHSGLKIYETATMTELCSVSPSGVPVHVALSTDERRAYLTKHVANELVVINIDESDPNGFCTEITTLSVGTSNSTGIVTVSPDGATVYVGNSGSDDYIVVIDADTATDTYSINCTTPTGLSAIFAMSPGRSRLYSADGESDAIVVVDTNDPCNDSLWLPMGVVFNGVKGIAVSPDESTIYVACENDDTVWVIDADTLTPIKQITVGDNPQRVVCHPACPDGSIIYVTCPLDNDVWIIDASAE